VTTTRPHILTHDLSPHIKHREELVLPPLNIRLKVMPTLLVEQFPPDNVVTISILYTATLSLYTEQKLRCAPPTPLLAPLRTTSALPTQAVYVSDRTVSITAESSHTEQVEAWAGMYLTIQTCEYLVGICTLPWETLNVELGEVTNLKIYGREGVKWMFSGSRGVSFNV
jgi:hypothetical protein